MMKPFSALSAASPSCSLRNVLAVAFAIVLTAASAKAQDAKAIITAVVQRELAANRDDHSAFQYKDHDVTPDHDTLVYLVETPQGSLKKKLEDHGQPLSPAERQADNDRIQALLKDNDAIQRARKDASHDDNQENELLKLLPEGFIWTIASENGNMVTLDFKPDPSFTPKTYESRALAAMGGQVVVDRKQNRMATIRGMLLDDVTFGFGIFGRLRKGGTFHVERREIYPGHWQMTESKVHITGHALFFKTIGSQEDELRSDFKPSPAQNLQQAAEILNQIH